MVNFLVILFLLPITSFAEKTKLLGSAKEGKSKAAACFACHGEKGISFNDLWPNLAGQKQAYLLKQLKDFNDGARKDPLMQVQAKGISQKDLEDITAYFSSLKP